MPLTPLHLVPAWAVFATGPRRWSFAGLSAGAMIPDVEVPVSYLFGIQGDNGHGVMHSVLGGVTIDLFLAVAAVYFILPTLANWWIAGFGARWIHFKGVDVSEIDSLPKVAFGCLVGIASHLGLDYLTHPSMPYLWPFGGPVSTFQLASEVWFSISVSAVLLVLLIVMLRQWLGVVAQPTHPELDIR